MSVDKVCQWLDRTGFPLEMEAASAFRRAGFEVRQSFTYPDPQSEKGREIDVLATQPDFMRVIEISFIVECKASPNPWVVLTSEDALRNYNRLFAFAITSNAARRVLAERWQQGLGKILPHIERPSRGGYGFRQAFAKDNDPAYSAAIAVMKASQGVAKDREGMPKLAFAFPVIVVDAPLFECSLAENNSGLNLEEVEQSNFLFSVHTPQEIGCCVKVVTRRKLNSYAGWAKELADTITMELKEEEDKAFGKRRKPTCGA